MADWSIGELGRRAGVAPSAIRYYESVGLLPRAPRRSGQRRYDAAALPRLALVRLAQEAGFSIAEIRTLLHGFSSSTPPSRRWQQLATRKREELRARIARARAMERVLVRLLACECPTLDDCGRAVAGRARRAGRSR